MLETYIKKIASTTKRGDAREESYYSALQQLLETFSTDKRKKRAQVTVLPKKTEAGNPDFRVWDGKHSQVGYVEAKVPMAKLDDVEETEQLERYRGTFPNLILTNFYEFRLYRNGQMIDKVLLARPFIAAKLGSVPPVEHEREFLQLLEQFFSFSLPTKFTAETLAKQLAIKTRFLRDQVIKEELKEASSKSGKKILNFYDAFKKHLISNLEPDQFADLYSQTITYGLFAARTRAEGEFSRAEAYTLIPKTIGILRDIFHFVSYDPPEQMQVTVDDIAEILAAADVKEILHQYYDEGKGSDPIFHFYETFLSEYNPEERERRGVYYTPEPVVSYIVRSLDIILKGKFDRKDGFATQSVTVLDPAGGTLTFLAQAAKLAVEQYTVKYGHGSRAKFIEDHILEHFYAFELMMAPYAAGHMKMGYLLEELGHQLKGDERLRYYLTNTLEMEDLAKTAIPGVESLTEESQLAGKVKRNQPILVVLGNPPYSGISANASEKEVLVKKGENFITGFDIQAVTENRKTKHKLVPKTARAKKTKRVRQKTWIGQLIESYKIIDGKWLDERNPKMLQDDYVKFIRFAQWKLDSVGEGILGFITNRSYIENITFPGMRESLLGSFDEIYVLDLHGDAMTNRSHGEPGARDENVFDITKGVAIILAVKAKIGHSKPRISYAEIRGLREAKYQYLKTNDVNTTKWRKIEPKSPSYFLIPKGEKHINAYRKGVSLEGIFPLNLGGVKTHRDHLVIDGNRNSLIRRIRLMTDPSLDDRFVAASLKLENTGSWNLADARKALKDFDIENTIERILYRPFDEQFIFYHDAVVERSRREVVRHMLSDNISLLAMRQVTLEEQYSHVFASTSMVDNRAFFSTKGIIQQFPLYLYAQPKKSKRGSGVVMMLFEPESDYDSKGRVPNISPELLETLKTQYKKQPTPEEIFNYVYAILYSNSYRQKYGEFLKTDFPRVPFTSDRKLFLKLAGKGEQLVELHLLKSKKLDKPIARCEGSGNLRVEKVAYDESKKRVYVNPETYFAGVQKEIWQYHVGGYQVAEKWLKDRKGRTLSSEEVAHYCRVVTALAETIKIQTGLDELFEEVEKSVIGR